MAIATQFHDFQNRGAPADVDAHASKGKTSPNLAAIRDYLMSTFGGQVLGIAPYRRPVVGGSKPSTHSWGALDWRYENPGPGREVLLDTIIPFLINHSAEFGIQAIHDYVGCRIWRPPGTSGRPADGSGWKAQTPGSQMGRSWALWIHIESHPSRWFDDRPLPDRIGNAPKPQPSKPTPQPTPKPPTTGVFTVEAKRREIKATTPVMQGYDVFVFQAIYNAWDDYGKFKKRILATDGKAGPQTVAAIKEWQVGHGLKADGMCGPKTWATVENGVG